MHPPPALADKGDIDDLGYTDMNLFDKQEEEPLNEYTNMKETDGLNNEKDLGEDATKAIECGANTDTNMFDNTWTDSNHYGLMAINNQKGRNLDPTVSEALSGEDRKHWEEAMHKELDGLKAMDTWEIVDLPKGMHAINTHWVLKIKTDANLILMKFKARLVARGFTQREGIDYTEVFVPVTPIQSI
ncbi:uncharacterized protein UHO2_00223 [Ustilago hordei]|uniref:uncharacterized protein n=1 Tax=Ustilago hordei TaxID=120017 RepID=UPI001A3EB21B|nr:uncharacterized protein UHO2_00223 [Ustilago hordei]SYW81719.1 related to retrotransposon protein [Ustilago hordei]